MDHVTEGSTQSSSPGYPGDRLASVMETVIRRRKSGEQLLDVSIVEAHPDLMPQLGQKLYALRMVQDAERRARMDPDGSKGSSDAIRGGVFEGSRDLTAPSGQVPGCDIQEEIYRGGQGVVYRARHRTTGRDVAIKVLRDGPFQGAPDRARFEREVRILGQLQHPNIVTIHDSGTAVGSYYFVMDYIRGEALDRYVTAHDLGVDETLDLFKRICRAVNAAHVRGIIHRDLKPSNILIDAQGEPHILDFGLAKSTTEDVSGAGELRALMMTMTGQFVGSLPWASPEQAEGSPELIDLRTDVYALGVVLHQMLTGRFPYEVEGTMRDVLGNIVGVAPTRPGSLRKGIGNEVDTIVLKCLAKEPDQRYQTAGAVADDVERHLTNQPILARPPSTVYQLKKLAARHKLPVALIALVLVLLSGSGIWMGILYRHASVQRQRAVDAEQRATREARTASAVNDFLVTGMLASAQPEVAQGSEISVQDVLRSASQRIEGAFPDQPLIEAGIRAAIGQSYVSLGLYGLAEPHLRKALAIRTRELGDEHEDALRARTRLVDLLYRQGAILDAIPVAADTLERSRRILGEEHEVSLEAAFQQARLLWFQGLLAESNELHRHVLEIRRRVLGNDHPVTLASLNQWGYQGMVYRTDLAGAEGLFREALAIGRRTLGGDHPETLRAMVNLGGALMEMRRLEAAEPMLSQGFRATTRVLGEAHPDTLMATIRLAVLRKEQDRIDEAEELSRKALEISRRILGADHPVTLSALQVYGTILLRHGKNMAGAEIFRKAVQAEGRLGVIGEESAAQALDCLSVAVAHMGRYADAEGGHRVALQEHRRLRKDQAMNNAWALRCLIRVLSLQGKEDEARPLAEELLELRRTVAESPDPDAYKLNCYARELLTVYPTDLRDPKRGLEIALQAFALSGDAYHYNRYTLARAYEMNGDLDQAVEFARRALAHIPAEYSRERAEYEAALVRMLETTGDLDGAQAVYRDTLQLRREQFPVGHLDIAESLVRLGETRIRHGAFDEAEASLREALEIRENALEEGDWHIGEAMSVLGASLAGQDRSAEAEPLMVDGFTVLVESPMAYSNQTRLALARIERFYRNTDHPDDALAYRNMLPIPEPDDVPTAP